MAIGAILGGVGSLIGAGSAIAGLADAGSSSSPGSTYGGPSGAATYIPSDQPGADQLYQSLINQMSPYATSLPGQVIPEYQNLYSNVTNNPYSSGALTGATTAAGYGPTLGNYGLGAASSLYGAGNQILNTAFNTNNAAYNQAQQQTVDQSNATNSMYGLGSSPYGAGVAANNLNNFNIAWQQQQLQNEAQGIQSAGQAYSGAVNTGGQGVSDISTLASLPSQTYLGQQTQNLSALQALEGGYSSAFGPSESLANLLQSYLGLGQSATGLAQAGQAQSFNQSQQLGQSLSTALTNPSLASLFSGSNSSSPGAYYGSSDYYSGGYSDPYATSDYSSGVPLAY